MPRRVHAELRLEGKGREWLPGGKPISRRRRFRGERRGRVAVEKSRSFVEKLFDEDLRKRLVSPDDFEPGDNSAPEDEGVTPPSISISSAVLDSADGWRSASETAYPTRSHP